MECGFSEGGVTMSLSLSDEGLFDLNLRSLDDCGDYEDADEQIRHVA